MAPDPRFRKAFSFMRALGIADEEVKPVLKKLLRTYDQNWELIEDDNYRALVDAYFDFTDDKGENKEGKHVLADKETSPTISQQKVIKPSPSRTSMGDVEPQTNSQASHAESNLSEVDKKVLVKPRAKKPKLRFPSTNHDGISDASNENLSVKTHSTQGRDKEIKDAGSSCNDNTTAYDGSITIGSSCLGEVKMSLNCDSVLGQPNFSIPKLDVVMKFMEKKYFPSSSSVGSSSFSMGKLLDDFCSSYLKLGNRKGSQQSVNQGEKNSFRFISDITRGSEKVKISLIDESGKEDIPKFNYIPCNIIYQSASVNISLARISDEDCCSDCSGSCVSASLPCACARETGGEFAYTPQGLLKEKFLTACISMKNSPQDHFVYCQECPLEKSKNEYRPERCKGHLVRKFIKECWRKCGCDMNCGNRIVQRGIRCKLQVFVTSKGKGWGVRTLEDLPKGTFVCEYVGEVLTNTELYDRNVQNSGKDKHTYPVTLDADWGSEERLLDEEALCLDATYNGNVGRFINHRCFDATLIDIPVEVETPDHHYYHLAFFTTRKVNAYEELTWDYGIDFDDHGHPIEAFQCCCGSAFCRDKKQKGKIEN